MEGSTWTWRQRPQGIGGEAPRREENMRTAGISERHIHFKWKILPKTFLLLAKRNEIQS